MGYDAFDVVDNNNDGVIDREVVQRAFYNFKT